MGGGGKVAFGNIGVKLRLHLEKSASKVPCKRSKSLFVVVDFCFALGQADQFNSLLSPD